MGIHNKTRARAGFTVKDSQSNTKEHADNHHARKTPQPDRRTRRAVSKQQSKGDKARGVVERYFAGIIVVFAILVAGLMLYGPVKDLYTAKRDIQIRQQVLEKITNNNKKHEAEIARLQTKEGIQDEARKRGLVGKGEIAVTVTMPEEAHNAPAGDNSETDDEHASSGGTSASEEKNEKPSKDKQNTNKQNDSSKEDGIDEIGTTYVFPTTPLYRVLDTIFMYTPPQIKVR